MNENRIYQTVIVPKVRQAFCLNEEVRYLLFGDVVLPQDTILKEQVDAVYTAISALLETCEKKSR